MIQLLNLTRDKSGSFTEMVVSEFPDDKYDEAYKRLLKSIDASCVEDGIYHLEPPNDPIKLALVGTAAKGAVEPPKTGDNFFTRPGNVPSEAVPRGGWEPKDGNE